MVYICFFIGLIIALLVVAVSWIQGDWSMMMKYSGSFGVACLLLSGIFLGSNLDGDRLRANFATESKQDRDRRWKWSNALLLISLPNIVSAIIIAYLFYM